MNKLVLFTLLVACGSVLADTASDCAALTTSATCAANTSCTFTTASTTCTNKCTALSTTDCANNTNSPNCDVVSSCAQGYATCSTLTTDTTCNGQTACKWTAATTAACAFKGTVLADACAAKNASKAACEVDAAKCAYTAGTYKQCDAKANACDALTEGNCDATYCQNAFVCYAKYSADNAGAACSTLAQTPCEASGTAGTGCSWNGTACVDDCAAFVTTATCTPATKCSVKTAYACSNKADLQTTCAAKNEGGCGTASAFCNSTLNTGTCAVVNTYCSAKADKTACDLDATNCQYNAAVTANCSNKATAAECTALTASGTCGANAGCTWKATSCANKTAAACATTDAKAACEGTGKFCTYAETGTCGVSSTSSSILAVSLIAIIALI